MVISERATWLVDKWDVGGGSKTFCPSDAQMSEADETWLLLATFWVGAHFEHLIRGGPDAAWLFKPLSNTEVEWKNLDFKPNLGHSPGSHMSSDQAGRIRSAYVSIWKLPDALRLLKSANWKWAGHVTRVIDNWANIITSWTPVGNRKRGRCKTRWVEGIIALDRNWTTSAQTEQRGQLRGRPLSSSGTRTAEDDAVSIRIIVLSSLW